MRRRIEIFGDLVKAVDASSDQDQLVAALREFPSDGFADTGRCAGDDGRSVVLPAAEGTRGLTLPALAEVAS